MWMWMRMRTWGCGCGCVRLCCNSVLAIVSIARSQVLQPTTKCLPSECDCIFLHPASFSFNYSYYCFFLFFGLGTLHKDFSAWLGHTFWGNQRFSRLAYAFISPKPRRWIPSSHRMRLLQKLIKIVITLPPPLLFSDSNYNYNSGSNFQLRP